MRADRAENVAQFWNYLPAFRAVAEHEHYGRGAQALGVTPPAVSRSIRVLEENLGVALFTPHGRGVRLTKAGHDLLGAVRDSMRRVDDGVRAARGRGFQSVVRVSCASSWAARVVSALMGLAEEWPGLVPLVHDPVGTDVARGLLQGELDLAITHAPPESADVEVLEIAAQRFGVYCAAVHPLFDAQDVQAEALVDAAFVIAAGADDGTSTRWPSSWPRQAVVQASNLGVRLGVCMTRPVLAVLPDLAVRDHLAAGRLKRLPGPELPARLLYAVRRRQLIADDVVQSAVEAIAAELA